MEGVSQGRMCPVPEGREGREGVLRGGHGAFRPPRSAADTLAPGPRSRAPRGSGGTMRGDAPRQQGPPHPRAQTFPRTPVLPMPHSTGTTRAVFLVFAYGSPRPQEDSRGRSLSPGRVRSLPRPPHPRPQQEGFPKALGTHHSTGEPPALGPRVRGAERVSPQTVIYFRTKCITPRTCQVPPSGQRGAGNLTN